MKKAGLYFLLFLCFLSTKAFHIVGGEIEFIYLSDGMYRINLIQYFDQAQNQNPGPEQFVTVFIFRNGDNELMSQHTLSLVGVEAVEYTNIECAIDELRTSRVFYSVDISLDPNLYQSEDGYYIQWERCCRNSTVDNIINPDGTGMNYVLEIPPLMKDGQIFQNSSPILFRPLSDYACVNQLFYTEFTGTDPDGDSLVYSLATPLNSSAQLAIPVPQPKPHFNVTFVPGISETNMIPGSRALRISDRGLLTVNPSETGLYVFSIKVEEFRDGVKIGEVRRDFQMLVVDGCEPPDPPVVDIDIPGDPDFDPETDILTYTVADAKCFDFLVSNISEGETISFRAEGVNFDEDLDEIFNINQVPVAGADQLMIEVCIPDCPPIRDEPFILDLIAADDACPLPQLDTVRLTIVVQPPPNQTPLPSFETLTIIQQVDNDPIFSQPLNATDPDNDDLELTLFIEDISDPTLFGFDLNVTASNAGSIQSNFSWDTDCVAFDFSEINQFDVKVVVNDSDQCDVPGDTVSISATVILPPNSDPFVSLEAPLPDQIDLGSTMNFNVSATDADGDDVSLRFVGGNFDPVFYGVSFEEVSGNSNISSIFNWELACDDSRFQDGQEFELLFIADDDDRCKIKNFDTLRHLLQVNYPVNSTPIFGSIDQFQSLRVNKAVQIPISATDADIDNITIEFAAGFRQPASQSLNLETVSGDGTAQTILEWQPECSLLRFGENSSLQDVIIQVSDNACPNANVDTLKITFEIFDERESARSFTPPNVFTPNGDGLNDTFRLSGSPDETQNLPIDNCDNTFEYIVINNRAGAQVFKSSSRDFFWSGGQFPAGIYYYVVKYTNTEFKGYIHLIR
ncbi:MAG: gliding motility-associated C-terminal domain-containing protein [Bacteroidota bacterium]